MEYQLIDNTLTIKGKVKEEIETKEAQYHLRERRYGSFSRSISLRDTIKADGILTISLPKVEPAKKAFNRIKVNLPKVKLSNGKKERTIKVSSN